MTKSALLGGNRGRCRRRLAAHRRKAHFHSQSGIIVVEPNRCAVQLADGRYQAEAETGAWVTAALLKTDEAFEHTLPVRFRHPRSRVGDGQYDFQAVGSDSHGDEPLLGCVLRRCRVRWPPPAKAVPVAR